MTFKKIAVLTSEKSWFIPYAKKLVFILRNRSVQAKLFNRHEDVPDDYEVVFILSYFRITDKVFLSRHRHNLVVHESDLPKGRGFAPLFWQILEGKKRIPIALFEAGESVDDGYIYLRDIIVCEGHELHDEIREKQARKIIELCLDFLGKHGKLKPRKQKGDPTFYKRRTPADSELNKNETLKEQFNLLRIVNNEEFPAFFYHEGYKYILKIYKEKEEKQK